MAQTSSFRLLVFPGCPLLSKQIRDAGFTLSVRDGKRLDYMLTGFGVAFESDLMNEDEYNGIIKRLVQYVIQGFGAGAVHVSARSKMQMTGSTAIN